MANLGSLNPIQPVDIEEGKRQLSVANQAVTDVAARGFVFPNLPQNQAYRGVLPMNLVHLDDTQLGDLLTQIATWCGYADMELAKARAARNEAEEKLKFIQSRLRLAVKAAAEGKKPSNPEMDDVVNSDPRVVLAKRDSLYCEAVFDYTKQLVDAAQRDWETVSRRITQRGQEVDRMTRGSNIGGVPVMASAFQKR